jgi:hypothetical protein
VAAACEVAHVRTVVEREGTWLEGLELGVGGGPMEPSVLLMKGKSGDPMSSICSVGWSVFIKGVTIKVLPSWDRLALKDSCLAVPWLFVN